MQIIKRYSHKNGEEVLQEHKKTIISEITTVIDQISAVDCLTKISLESSKVRRWGGLIFSPRTMNILFREYLYPLGWAKFDAQKRKYIEPTIYFDNEAGRNDRFRKMDGIKDRVGLEIQFGKYAFMGYDIFSKMVIFKNNDLIDYGIEIVLVQDMADCMSTGVSAFEHIMIDFKHRGVADIDIPVLVLGIGPTEEEWRTVSEIQEAYRDNPDETLKRYPHIGKDNMRGTAPGPKS